MTMVPEQGTMTPNSGAGTGGGGGGSPPVLGNIDLYVATTGSDSNPGTITAPFATIQRAMNVLTGLSQTSIFGGTTTIHVADGTYNITHSITFANIGNATLLGDDATPTNCIIKGGGFNMMDVNGSNCAWTIDGFEFDTNGGGDVLTCGALASAFCKSFAINDSAASGNTLFISASFSGSVTFEVTTITFLTNSFAAFVNSETGSFVEIALCTINLAANTTYTAQDFISQYAFWDFTNNTVNNLATANAGGLQMQDYSEWSSTNGLLSDYPSQSPTFKADGTCALRVNVNLGQNTQTFFDQFNAGLPTTSNLSPGMWAIAKDTTGGGMYLVANDGGVIKKVAMV